MATKKQGVPVVVPADVWQPLMEIRAQLDSDCPGAPTPIEELLREVISHYERCEKAADEAEDFCKRAQAWKKSGWAAREWGERKGGLTAEQDELCFIIGMQEAERMKSGTIKQAVLIDATPLEVYEAYVDPKKHAAFTGQSATGAPKVGGRFTAGDGYITGKYLVLEKGKRILHEWTTTEWPKGYPVSILELTLKAKGKKTELTMVHSKVPEEQVDYYAEGWKEYYWKPLQKYFTKKTM